MQFFELIQGYGIFIKSMDYCVPVLFVIFFD